jgi:predicted ATPase
MVEKAAARRLGILVISGYRSLRDVRLALGALNMVTGAGNTPRLSCLLRLDLPRC